MNAKPAKPMDLLSGLNITTNVERPKGSTPTKANGPRQSYLKSLSKQIDLINEGVEVSSKTKRPVYFLRDGKAIMPFKYGPVLFSVGDAKGIEAPDLAMLKGQISKLSQIVESGALDEVLADAAAQAKAKLGK